ncbi:MAG: signal peptidase II [Selenomonadaceae bacterium]|nr:signal peptidase II [Selenomonadaceae bacterium]
MFYNWEKVLFVVVVALDQITKAMVMRSFVPGESIPILQDIFHLTYVLNPGAAFGILSNQRMFLLITGAGLIVATAYFYPLLKKSDGCLRFGATAILSGAVANLIDRIQTGCVVDFFDLRVWPVFNVADIAIVLGMGFMIYAILFRLDDSRKVERIRE